MILEQRRRIVDAVSERGWELVPHNWAQNDLLTYYAYDPEQERAVIRRTLVPQNTVVAQRRPLTGSRFVNGLKSTPPPRPST
jgi:hypothetical protein